MYDRPSSDSGVALGTVLGVILALVIVALLVWLFLGNGLRGSNTTTPSGGNTNITVNPPAGNNGGGTGTGTGGATTKPQGFVAPSGAYIGLS